MNQLVNLQERAKLNNRQLLQLAAHSIGSVNLKTIQNWQSGISPTPKLIIDNLNTYIERMRSYHVK